MSERGWFDKQFADTSIVVLGLFSFCCGWVALIFGIIGLIVCKEPKAKQNALIVVIVSAVMFAVSFAFGFLSALTGGAPPG